MRRARNKKTSYCISYKKVKAVSDGWTTFEQTNSLGRARFLAKKLPLKYRQIDVRQLGRKPYVLEGSWL